MGLLLPQPLQVIAEALLFLADLLLVVAEAGIHRMEVLGKQVSAAVVVVVVLIVMAAPLRGTMEQLVLWVFQQELAHQGLVVLVLVLAAEVWVAPVALVFPAAVVVVSEVAVPVMVVSVHLLAVVVVVVLMETLLAAAPVAHLLHTLVAQVFTAAVAAVGL